MIGSGFIKRHFANIAAAQTDAALVTAIAGTAIKVCGAYVKAGSTATAITFNSKGAGAGTPVTCLFAMGINGDLELPFTGEGWFETTVGQGLTCTTGAGATTGIQLIYSVTVP